MFTSQWLPMFLYSAHSPTPTRLSPCTSTRPLLLAFKPFWRLRVGEHHARASPQWRAPPRPWASRWWPRGPQPPWNGQGGRGRRPSPHPVSFAATHGGWGPVGFGLGAHVATEQGCGVWPTVSRQRLQAQEPLGSIWPLLRYWGNSRGTGQMSSGTYSPPHLTLSDLDHYNATLSVRCSLHPIARVWKRSDTFHRHIMLRSKIFPWGEHRVVCVHVPPEDWRCGFWREGELLPFKNMIFCTQLTWLEFGFQKSGK